MHDIISYLSDWLRGHRCIVKAVDTEQKQLKVKMNFVFETVVDSTGSRNTLIHEISV
jgi:hypothetical protein